MTDGAGTAKRRADLRAFWVQVHLWLGLTLGVAGAFLGLSGSVLVYDREVDALLNPSRYATTGADAPLAFADYMARAAQAVPGRARPSALRMPDGAAGPIVVFARADAGAFQRVYVDPPSGRVLDVSAGTDLVNWLHGLHESLHLRDYGGRSIVGAIGIAMLVSALTGIYHWWPLRGLDGTAFGFRAGLAMSRNLHYTFGFYGSILLAMLSFTGIYLAYPDAGRASVAAFGSVSPSPRGVQASESSGRPIGVDAAVAVARRQYPDAAVTAIGMPTGPRGAYRVSLREHGDSGARPSAVVFVDPTTSAIVQHAGMATLTHGDAFLAAQRTLHEGHWWGPAGRALTCAAGCLPALLVVTGSIIWLRSRKRRNVAPIAAATAASND